MSFDRTHSASGRVCMETETTEALDPNPVRCGSCGWEGDATELLEEGHCPQGCHAASVAEVSEEVEQ